jgi:hypothetical protein
VQGYEVPLTLMLLRLHELLLTGLGGYQQGRIYHPYCPSSRLGFRLTFLLTLYDFV